MNSFCKALDRVLPCNIEFYLSVYGAMNVTDWAVVGVVCVLFSVSLAVFLDNMRK